jgi:putative cardiolipin synthase
LIDRAEKTLDLQYYIFHDDLTGKFVYDRLMAAADRGVRVRLLLDDWHQTPETDWLLATLASHPNIEVRLFNPFGTHRRTLPARVLRWLDPRLGGPRQGIYRRQCVRVGAQYQAECRGQR